MSYTATDNFSAKTTAPMQVAQTTLPLSSAGPLCSSSVSAPAWVQIKSSAGNETVKVLGCIAGVPTITPTTLGHPSGACVVGITIPLELVCAMMAACQADPCAPLEVI
jgi:hypothetical protein